MQDAPTKMYWMGRDVDEMSREQLVAVVRGLAAQLEMARQATKSIIEVHDLARRARA